MQVGLIGGAAEVLWKTVHACYGSTADLQRTVMSSESLMHGDAC